MNDKILAKINPNRSITFTADAQIRITWDDQSFDFDFYEFTDLISTLEEGARCDYTDCATCCFVRIDNDSQEVWIQETCLMLGRREFRALLNAVLSTKTRLYGILRSLPNPTDPLEDVEVRWVGAMGRPPRIRRTPN
jgi:hypothetical protein